MGPVTRPSSFSMICVSYALMAALYGCSSGGDSTAASGTSPVSTITATVATTLSGESTTTTTLMTFYGYTSYDCEWGQSGGNNTLAIYAYSGGCEFCGDTLAIYLADTMLPGGESVSCDTTDHSISYEQPGLGLYLSDSTLLGSCSELQVNSFQAATGASISGSFYQATLMPDQEQGGEVTVTGGTFSCSSLYLGVD